jgi:hypothetical protein
MPLDIFTPMQLYAVMFDRRQTVRASQWLDMFFPNSFLSDQQEIMFDQIDASREIAPFMLPNVPGRPIYRTEGERITTYKPAYTKPKDPVVPQTALQLQPGELAKRQALMSPEARFNQRVIDITRFHRDAIQRLWDYMAARSVIDGAITVNYQNAPGQSVTIDFGRDPNHTITKGAGDRWGDAGVKPWDDLQEWIDLASGAEFGAAVTDIMLGADAWKALQADADTEKKLNTDIRGAESIFIERGLIQKDPLNPFTLVGMAGSIRIWLVSGIGNTFKSGGATVDILGSKEVLLASAAVDGVKAFGAIMDVNALMPAEIWPKMWDEQDPSARFIMSQSAPLMIPVNPNATVKATVLA